MCGKMKLDHLLMLHTRLNSEWIKNLNIRLETIKILEENIGSKIWDSNHSNIVFYYISSGKGNKRKNKQMGPHQTKILYHNGNLHKMKGQSTEWENIFVSTSDKGLINQIYKELIQLNTKKNPIKNGQRTLRDISPQRTCRWPIDIWKDAQCH